MADFTLNPAYNARLAAGQVQTPGLVDWVGIGQRIYDDLQAPYWRRQDEIQGAAVADPMQSRYVAQPRFVAAMGQDPLQQYAESGYVAKPRFVSAPSPKTSAPWTSDNYQMAAIRNAEQPRFKVATGPDGNRLTPNAYGYGTTDGYSGVSAVAAIDNMAPRVNGPTFPLKMPGKGTPLSGNYTASMRFASPNAGNGSEVLNLSFDPISDVGGQNTANSAGKPVRFANGKVYYPSNTPMSGVRAPMQPVANQPQQRQQPGLFGGLFGGGNSGSGILSGLFGGGGGTSAPAIGNSPSQGLAMTVSPGTSSGQVLSGMGFSDGALVPAATVRNLESRGYFK